jgi:hypothetical protein
MKKHGNQNMFKCGMEDKIVVEFIRRIMGTFLFKNPFCDLILSS